MNDHPSQFALEAHFVGETDDGITAHISTCTYCQGRLKNLESERSAHLDAESASAFFQRPVIQAALFQEGTTARTGPLARWTLWLTSTLAIAAAAIVYMVVSPHTANERSTDRVLLKGQVVHLSVLMDRDGRQTEHQGDVSVRPGDRLRFRIQLGHSVRLSAGILTHDRQWLELTRDTAFSAGTHFLHNDALRIDESPTQGKVYVGRPERIQQARQTGQFNGLTSMTVRTLP